MHTAKIRISGIVQGVGFRPFVYRTARIRGLRGYVKNLGDAGVEVRLSGGKKTIQLFVENLKDSAPENAKIEDIDIQWVEEKNRFRDFRIIPSGGSGLGGTVSPDVGVCERCVEEIFDIDNRRYNYPFTACLDCGARFTILKNIPYDRINTSFSEFVMCDSCDEEYKNPENRRFHAQTIACPECGPHYYLLDSKGKNISNPIKNTVNALKDGKIVCIKGAGGMHIVCRATEDALIRRLRKRLNRPNQPFAIMCADTDMVERLADTKKDERELLKSKEKPIVIVQKRKDHIISDLVSPGLDNIGIMLPYMGIHYLLFRGISEPLVMTSANISGEPMLTENEQAKAMNAADMYLFHNLKISNRCDDSIIKIVNNKKTFLRRSRGFVPAALTLKIKSKSNKPTDNVLALGAELNTSICLLKGRNNAAFLSQYIGDTRSPKTMEFLEESIRYLLNLTGVKPDVVACDLHPLFNTTKLAERISSELGVPLVRVQHHYAHLSSLVAEHGIREIIGICCDGVGYAVDGLWGGEVITYADGGFDRIGHLMEQKMPGGDAAVRYPARMAAGILYDRFSEAELRDILIRNKLYFRHKEKEIDVVLTQLNKNINVFRTSSMGRVLDAIASILEICPQRTYEAESAMKLESAGNRGTPIYADQIPLKVRKNILDTSIIVEKVLELKEEGYRIEDISISAEKALAEGIAKIAVSEADKKGIQTIGITGGVAYNNSIVRFVADYVEENRLRFLQHVNIPCGDGGISFGQAGYVRMCNRCIGKSY